MLAQSQIQPFNYTITNFKTLLHNQHIDKHQSHIKATLKTLNELTNLSQSMKLLIDNQSCDMLNKVAGKFVGVFVADKGDGKHMASIDNLLTNSPVKTHDKNKQMLLKHTKHIDLTPSTKKSRVFSNHSIPHLIEDLIDSLQKFDELKQNSNRIKILIKRLYDELIMKEEGGYLQEEDMQDDGRENCEMLWREVCGVKEDELRLKVGKVVENQALINVFFQLIEHIENIHRSIETIKSATIDIYNFFDPESIDEQDNQSRDGDSYQLQAITKKSNNPSQQRSLLTEMLKDSSQKSILQLPSQTQNQYSSQIVLRPRLRFKEYSQNQNDAQLDSGFKLSYKSAKFNHKSYNKEIKSEMSIVDHLNEQNVFDCEKIVRRKEVKIKRSEMSCSRCQIF